MFFFLVTDFLLIIVNFTVNMTEHCHWKLLKYFRISTVARDIKYQALRTTEINYVADKTFYLPVVAPKHIIYCYQKKNAK